MKPFPHQTRTFQRDAFTQRGGFTLIEITVVLAIAAIVSAITLGGFRSMSDNNQRTGCQANMAQIYQALRQYMADEGGAPIYNPATPAEKGIGLWNLWTFPASTDFNALPNVNDRPFGRYLRSAKVLHCPSDIDEGRTELYSNPDKTQYNPNYLSYQGRYKIEPPTFLYTPETPAPAFDANKESYLPTRTTDTSNRGLFVRQLNPQRLSTTAGLPNEDVALPPNGQTVVFWCPWHRIVRDSDNVLFFDGSIQLIPRVQDKYADANGCNVIGTLEDWHREPRRIDCQ